MKLRRTFLHTLHAIRKQKKSLNARPKFVNFNVKSKNLETIRGNYPHEGSSTKKNMSDCRVFTGYTCPSKFLVLCQMFFFSRNKNIKWLEFQQCTRLYRLAKLEMELGSAYENDRWDSDVHSRHVKVQRYLDA